MRRVRRARHDVRGRSRTDHPRPRDVVARRCDRAVAISQHAVLHPNARVGRRSAGHRHGRAVGGPHGQAAEGHPPWCEGEDDRQVQEPLWTVSVVLDRIRRRDPVDQAAPRGQRQRLGPRPVRGVHAARGVLDMRRCSPETVDAGCHDRGQEHLRSGRHVDRRVGEVPRCAGADRTRSDDRRAGHQGDQRSIGIPARRRPRLPHHVAFGGHARRWRSAAHPAGIADRLRARGHALRARRAVDRAASSATTSG